MYAQGSKRLGSALTEANVAQLVRFGDSENMVYGVWDVVPSKIVNTEDNCSVEEQHMIDERP